MRYHPFVLLIVLCGLVLVSCNSSRNPLFGNKSLVNKYAQKIEDAGLKNTKMGREWFAASALSLNKPDSLALPLSETGFFTAATPAARGFLFSVKRGEKIMANISLKPAGAYTVFTELWRWSPNDRTLLESTDSAKKQIEYIVKKDGLFMLRLLPELLSDIEYTVTVTTGPSLAFPVSASGKPRIISVWGVDRDGGARRHEGIDIQAPERTPALAATDGIISRVGDNRLGGKVVFLSDPLTGNSLYYAHLDSQIAVRGQRVRTGDVIGLVGKTGNAINTVPHLHFGIYAVGGAINPLPFINKEIREPAAVNYPASRLQQWITTKAAGNVYERPAASAPVVQQVLTGTPVRAIAAQPGWLRITLPEGEHGFIQEKFISTKAGKKVWLATGTKLLSMPDSSAAGRAMLSQKMEVNMIGRYQDFYLVQMNDTYGWLQQDVYEKAKNIL